MADSDTPERIEQWARRALAAAEIELSDDTSVSAEAGSDGYVLSVDLPKGEGEQQTASAVQAALSDAVENDPTLGGLFEQVSVSPSGVEVVGTGEVGVRSMVELTVLDSDDDRSDSDESGDADEDDSGDDETGDGTTSDS